jgi:hypothetical protein
VSYEVLEGALATMKRLPLSKALVESFQKPELFKVCGLRKPPDQEYLKQLIDDKELVVWDIVPDGKTKGAGHALFVRFNGPPFIAIYTHDQKPDLELSRDCVLQLIHYFFQKTPEEGLYFYQQKPVPSEIHDLLVEGGFDPFEDNPTLDADEACYVLWRHTYVAYYGEESGGREGEFDSYDEDGGGDDEGGGEETTEDE